jgi:hypothetical protein
MQRLMLFIVLTVLCAGCGGPPRLDASSEKAMDASIKEMTANMSQDDKQAFALAMLKVTVKEHFKDGFAGAAKKAQEQTEKGSHVAFKPLHGKTAAQIIAAANATDTKK